ncbi:hypothetical protein KC19_1G056600 [Ceratodon purpureus]|uniref:Uncharacterized protein n=1 Tax=Ceratodon purpureus TaxID=3225 RepID=A0A8T0J2Z2_CERPU|nr:hypothetical protein KC19_1G056600 [Ceratodon purpureus]
MGIPGSGFPVSSIRTKMFVSLLSPNLEYQLEAFLLPISHKRMSFSGVRLLFKRSYYQKSSEWGILEGSHCGYSSGQNRARVPLQRRQYKSWLSWKLRTSFTEFFSNFSADLKRLPFYSILAISRVCA